MATISVIGGGIAGLSAAAYLAARGHTVDVFEKNATAGGRARTFTTEQGYVFDMGPSWYWMPDVFEKFFGDFGYKVSDFYSLRLLDPAFEMIFAEKQKVCIPPDPAALEDLFESIEPGSAPRLRQFMKEARAKYELALAELVYKPGLSVSEYLKPRVLSGVMRYNVFSSFEKHVHSYFKHPHLRLLMEFPVLFLGAMPADTPALYSLMNYAGLSLGTWYPQGGFGKVIDSMRQLAEMQGVRFHFRSAVERISIGNGKVTHFEVNGEQYDTDAVVGAADYHHMESLLPEEYRNYEEQYWQKRTMSPSCLIYYIGLSRKLPSLKHHTLFFEYHLEEHAKDIYKDPRWPSRPLFYVCAPSRTDHSVAPPGHENLFFLMPLAPGLNDDEALREHYFQNMMRRFEDHVGVTDLQSSIDFKRSYCVSDFTSDYNAYRGNAYGLANTLRQTAMFKPSIRNKKIRNLVYAGQLTVPGPGVPPALISGKIAAQQVSKYIKRYQHEVSF